MRTPSLAAAVLVLALPACGYRAVTSLRGPGGAARAIELAIFENRSAAPGFEKLLADALAEEFARRGELRPVWSGGDVGADLALRGVVRQVNVRPSAFSSVSLELEDRVEVELDVTLLSGPDRALVWRHARLLADESFLSSADAQVRTSNREQALRRLASELAARIHDELTQTF
jgi:hypothetical protein